MCHSNIYSFFSCSRMVRLVNPSLSRPFPFSPRAKHSNDHLPLPSATLRHRKPPRLGNSLLTKRYIRLLILAILLAVVYLFFPLYSRSVEPIQLYYKCKPHKCTRNPDLVLLPPPYPPTSPPTQNQREGFPPLFEQWIEHERSYWQHAEDDGTTKFVYMRNHVFASGWGNALQEMILNTHLAYLSGRSFVFDNYTWDRSPLDYSSFNGKVTASRVPVSAMLAGPIIGGTFDSPHPDPLFPNAHSQPHPPSVSSEYYEHVCSNQTRVILDTDKLHKSVGNWDGEQNLRVFVDYLRSFSERCIEFELDAEHVFNIWMFGSPDFLTLWPSLSQSPILQQFTYSPLILAAYERNRHFFELPSLPNQNQYSDTTALNEAYASTPDSDLLMSSSRLKKHLYNITTIPLLPSSRLTLPLVPLERLSSLYPHAPASPSLKDTIPGLVVLHIRRGDFEGHCENLIEWRASFHAFNSFEDMRERDGFDAGEAGGGSMNPSGGEPVEPKVPSYHRPSSSSSSSLSSSSMELEPSEESFLTWILSWLGFGPSQSEKDLAWETYRANLTAYASAKEDYRVKKEKYENAKGKYLERCFPDIEQMVRRVRRVREDVAEATAAKAAVDGDGKGSDTAPLTRLYMMTNGKPPFLDELKAALQADSEAQAQTTPSSSSSPSSPHRLPPWESIHTSRDLMHGHGERQGGGGGGLGGLGWEEQYVAQTLDIYVAQRAEVFVGNGFSSLTANVVMLRRAHGVEGVKTRLW
ncbi:hypothetical protein D9757_006575 [Collybiopsis confluens]|uniref:Uncharacterized protein n=1 Tax=Collybiopsis confluens TaxID=2823264 RepID=A0A8H5HQ77_9AGAR|nr:hypothetical protein D9757_006575 [Collybiopsis confluens]